MIIIGTYPAFRTALEWNFLWLSYNFRSFEGGFTTEKLNFFSFTITSLSIPNSDKIKWLIDMNFYQVNCYIFFSGTSNSLSGAKTLDRASFSLFFFPPFFLFPFLHFLKLNLSKYCIEVISHLPFIFFRGFNLMNPIISKKCERVIRFFWFKNRPAWNNIQRLSNWAGQHLKYDNHEIQA